MGKMKACIPTEKVQHKYTLYYYKYIYLQPQIEADYGLENSEAFEVCLQHLNLFVISHNT